MHVPCQAPYRLLTYSLVHWGIIAMVRLLLTLACSVAATPFAMAQDSQGLALAVPNNLKRFQNVRPAMPLGSMQSWIVSDGRQERVAVTTPDGFTIVGDLIGPGGQDLSSALLAISGLSTPIPPTGPPLASNLSPSPVPQPSDFVPPPAAVPSASALLQASPAASPTVSPASPTVGATPPPLTMAKAQTASEMFQQATDFSVWFSAGTPKPGAPAIYFIADPTCPYCAKAVDILAQKVKAGDIDLRVILAPIRSQQAVYEAASVLQSQNPGADFLSHELSKTTSNPSTLKVLAPAEINPDIVRGLQRNVEWIRANGVQGVPFWIYTTAEGGKVEFGEVKDDMLTSALPARGSGQVAQGAQP